jgi:hypothetical protein
MRVFRSTLGRALSVAGVLGLAVAVAPAAGQKRIDCELKYWLAGWSAFYKTAKGEGTITCDNGQKMRVALTVKGGGVTFGKTKIDDGRGKFSEVSNINDLLGGYAEAGVEAGAVKSTEATVLSNGRATLALAGKGQGWSLGVSGAKFTITRK